MTAAEKTMLRYEYTMQRLGIAQGDFVRTQHTWANQVRVLKQQFQALGAVIGQGLIQALKPALIAFNAFLTRVIEFAKQVLNALGKIFGWTVDISGGGLDTDLSEAEDAASGLGDALGGAGDNAGTAADNVKELKKQLQGFDKLNVLTTTDTGSGSGGSGGSGGGSGGSGGGGGAGSASDLQVSLEKTESLFESSIDNLYDLGQYISTSLQNVLDNIDWDSIYEKARNFGTGLASFLNGLFSGDPEHNVFASLGRTVAGAINTALNFFDSFAEEFDFTTFGTNLASFFVETVENIDWTMAGSAFHRWMQGIKDAFTAFVEYLWENKDEVWKAIKDFFKGGATIEDIAIFIGIMTISKIGKWVLAEGVFALAGQAIGLLFEGIGIAISAKILGVTAVEVTEFGLANSLLLIAQGVAESLGLATGAATVAGGLATLALPVAFAIVAHIVFRKMLDKMYDENNNPMEKNEAIDKIYEGGLGSMGIVRKNADLSYTVELDHTAWFSIKTGIKWIKDKWQTLESFVYENLGLNEDGTVDIGNINVNVGKILLALVSPFGSLVSWIKDAIGLASSGEVSIGDVFASIGKLILKLLTPFDFVKWLMEQIFGSNDDGTTDLGEREVTINPKLTAGVAGVIPFAAELITWFRDKSWINGGKDMNSINFWANLYTWYRDKKWTSGGKDMNSINFWANLYTWYRDKKWLNGGDSWNSVPFKAKLWDWFRTNQWINGGDSWNSIAFKARLTSYSLGSAVRNAVIDVAARITGRESGGVLTASGWKPIQQYATGGLPSYGQVFVAREAGPELVGTLGGHTAVMNNDQIVSSVASGVASAMSSQNEILLQQNALLRQLLAKETGISSSDIFDAVRSENRNYTNRTGKSAFSF